MPDEEAGQHHPLAEFAAGRMANTNVKHRTMRAVTGGLWCLGLFGMAGVSPAATLYTIQHLAGLEYPSRVRMSDNGRVVTNRFMWYQGSLVAPGGDFTSVESVNNAGQVAGITNAGGSSPMHAFRWQSGAMTLLPGLGGQEEYTVAINERGDVAGYADNASPESVINLRATLWRATGEVVDLGAVPPDSTSYAQALNNMGQVAGISTPSTGSSFGRDAFFWDGAQMIPFIENAGSEELSVHDLNDNGQVVGSYSSLAYIWQGGAFTQLTAPGIVGSSAWAINNTGQVVGTYWDSSGSGSRAFVYENGQMLDLRSLVSNPMGWSALTTAHDINSGGQIVGVGRFNAIDNSVFLLTPVPEPGTLLLVLAAGGAVWQRRRIRVKEAEACAALKNRGSLRRRRKALAQGAAYWCSSVIWPGGERIPPVTKTDNP